MTDTPPCAKHFNRPSAFRLIDLPCGCQNVHYADGTVCYEHNHVACDSEVERGLQQAEDLLRAEIDGGAN